MTWEDALKIVATSLASVGGAAGIILATSTWLGKVWANRILEKDRRRYGEELERVKADLDRIADRDRADLERATHMTAVQLGVEFQSMMEVWVAIAGLRKVGRVLPSGELGPPPTDEQTKRRLSDYRIAFELLVEARDSSSPFYPEEIVSAVIKLTDDARLELHEMENLPARERDPEFYPKRDAGHARLCANADLVAKLIRERMASLTVVR